MLQGDIRIPVQLAELQCDHHTPEVTDHHFRRPQTLQAEESECVSLQTVKSVLRIYGVGMC